jgi:hypothetical protein
MLDISLRVRAYHLAWYMCRLSDSMYMRVWQNEPILGRLRPALIIRRPNSHPYEPSKTPPLSQIHLLPFVQPPVDRKHLKLGT